MPRYADIFNKRQPILIIIAKFFLFLICIKWMFSIAVGEDLFKKNPLKYNLDFPPYLMFEYFCNCATDYMGVTRHAPENQHILHSITLPTRPLSYFYHIASYSVK